MARSGKRFSGSDSSSNKRKQGRTILCLCVRFCLFFAECGDRLNVRDIVILASDGASTLETDLVESEARKLADLGIRVFSIGEQQLRSRIWCSMPCSRERHSLANTFSLQGGSMLPEQHQAVHFCTMQVWGRTCGTEKGTGSRGRCGP